MNYRFIVSSRTFAAVNLFAFTPQHVKLLFRFTLSVNIPYWFSIVLTELRLSQAVCLKQECSAQAVV